MKNMMYIAFFKGRNLCLRKSLNVMSHLRPWIPISLSNFLPISIEKHCLRAMFDILTCTVSSDSDTRIYFSFFVPSS